MFLMVPQVGSVLDILPLRGGFGFSIQNRTAWQRTPWWVVLVLPELVALVLVGCMCEGEYEGSKKVERARDARIMVIQCCFAALQGMVSPTHL